MKTILHHALLCAAAFTLLCVSCNDTPTPGPNAPTVAFAPDYRVEGNTITFTLLTTDAEKAAYMLQERQTELPTAEEVISKGTQLSGKETYTVTSEQLTPGLDYTIYAAAANGTTISPLAKLEFSNGMVYDDLLTVTQTGKNFISYHIEAEPEATYRHAALLKKIVQNFTLGELSEQEYAQRIQLLLSLYGMPGTGAVDFTLHDLDPMPNGQPYDVMAGMTYMVMACRTDAAGNYVGDYRMIETLTPEPQDNGLGIGVEILHLEPRDVTVLCTPDQGLRYYIEQPVTKALSDQLLAEGGTQTLLEQLSMVAPRTTKFGEPSEWTFLAPQTEYIHYVIGVDAQGDRTQLIATPFTTPEEQEVDVDTENIVFDHMVMGWYYGMMEDDYGTPSYNFYFTLADKPMSPNEYGDPYPDAFPCHAINCDLYTQAPPVEDDFILPEGTYIFGESNVAGTWHPAYTWGAYFDQQEEKYELSMGDGSITVEHSGAEYRITLDLRTEKGKVYTGTYTGPLRFEEYASVYRTQKSRWVAPQNAPHAQKPNAQTPKRR